MNSGSFDGGLLGLTNWVGNAVMPILAVLILALGIFKYSRGYHIEPYIAGTMSALSVSGLLRLAEVFASQGSGTTQYGAAILCLANWVGNVILPVYGGIEIARAVLGWVDSSSGFTSATTGSVISLPAGHAFVYRA